MKNQKIEPSDYTAEFIGDVLTSTRIGKYALYGAGILTVLYFSKYFFNWGAESIIAWKKLRKAVIEPI